MEMFFRTKQSAPRVLYHGRRVWKQDNQCQTGQEILYNKKQLALAVYEDFCKQLVICMPSRRVIYLHFPLSSSVSPQRFLCIQ